MFVISRCSGVILKNIQKQLCFHEMTTINCVVHNNDVHLSTFLKDDIQGFPHKVIIMKSRKMYIIYISNLDLHLA